MYGRTNQTALEQFWRTKLKLKRRRLIQESAVLGPVLTPHQTSYRSPKSPKPLYFDPNAELPAKSLHSNNFLTVEDEQVFWKTINTKSRSRNRLVTSATPSGRFENLSLLYVEKLPITSEQYKMDVEVYRFLKKKEPRSRYPLLTPYPVCEEQNWRFCIEKSLKTS